MSADSWVNILCFQMYLASGRNIYIYSEMPTEVLCALLAHAAEVKGLNTGSTNFRSNSVVLLEYFLKCVSFAGLYLFISFNVFGAFSLCTSSCRGIRGWIFCRRWLYEISSPCPFMISGLCLYLLFILIITLIPAIPWAVVGNYNSLALCIAMPSVAFHSKTERKPKKFKLEFYFGKAIV